MKKDNIIGSLRGDIQKLHRSKDDLHDQIEWLCRELARQKELHKKTTSQLHAVKNSAAWQIGYTLVQAFRQPGRNTLLFPYRLLKVIYIHARNKMRPQGVGGPKAGSTAATNHTQVDISTVQEEGQKEFSLRSSISSPTLSELRIATIVDEFTYNCFEPECTLFQLTPENWLEEITALEPDLLFVEAAWRGKDDLWTGKIKHTAQETRELLAWCKENNIPTAFWAKEDPSDFNSFLSTASLFDYILTTDADCIEKYRNNLQHANVSLLPFAAQPRLHNPVEEYARKDGFCFAGAYYSHFPERVKDFEILYDALSSIGHVDIYDRNYDDDRNLFIFPYKYKGSILGSLPNNQISRAYKGYRFAININSIKNSSTMFARRVFELLASNTVVLSNSSRGMQRFFGDLVIQAENSEMLRERLSQLVDDEFYFRKFRLLALRKVMQEHTYEDRLARIAHLAWRLPEKQMPQVTTIGFAPNQKDLERILESYKRQSYVNKRLVLVTDLPLPTLQMEQEQEILIVSEAKAKNCKFINITTHGYIAAFCPEDYYGPNYLMDLMLATRYSSAPVIGKGAWHEIQDNRVFLQQQRLRYVYTNKLYMRSAVFLAGVQQDKPILEFLAQLPSAILHHPRCLSSDEFNYCRNCTTSQCPEVDDLEQIRCGLSLSEIFE